MHFIEIVAEAPVVELTKTHIDRQIHSRFSIHLLISLGQKICARFILQWWAVGFYSSDATVVLMDFYSAYKVKSFHVLICVNENKISWYCFTTAY